MQWMNACIDLKSILIPYLNVFLCLQQFLVFLCQEELVLCTAFSPLVDGFRKGCCLDVVCIAVAGFPLWKAWG